MNTPTHLVCGACLAQAIAQALAGGPHRRMRMAAVAAGALGLGVASHFLLDFLPHYAWVVYLTWLERLPYDWLIREAVFSFAIAVPAFLFAGRTWPYVALGMAGGIYPDVEKMLFFVFHLPDRFVLFTWHGTYLSNQTGGFPKPVLIGMECLLIGALLLAMWKMKRSAVSANSR